jgi:hypothetical protein
VKSLLPADVFSASVHVSSKLGRSADDVAAVPAPIYSATAIAMTSRFMDDLLFWYIDGFPVD